MYTSSSVKKGTSVTYKREQALLQEVFAFAHASCEGNDTRHEIVKPIFLKPLHEKLSKLINPEGGIAAETSDIRVGLL